MRNTMFSQKPKAPKSSELKDVDDLVEAEHGISVAKTPDRDSKRFALAQVSSSEKKFYLHNVKSTSSRIKDCDLAEFRQRYRIPDSVKMFVPKLGETADDPPKDCVAVYKIMLENGLRLPANDFVNEIMATVERAPAQVTHNSWVILTAFQVACHVAGVKLSIELFKTMYKFTYFNKDYMYFSQKRNKNLTLLNLPKKINRWEPYFFFVSANAFGEKVPKAFCWNTATFKCHQPDIEMQYWEFRKKFPQRFLFGAYLDEKVMLMCKIYKDAIKTPKEDAYDLLLKVNDALLQTAAAKNDQQVLHLFKEENLRTEKSAVASDVSVAFKPSEPDSKVPPVILSATPLSSVSAALETKKTNVSPADGDQDVEIIDIEKFLSSKKKPLSNTTCSPSASAWPKTSAGKRQVDGIGKSIANYPKKLRTSFKTLFDEIDDDLEDEEIPIKVKREMVKESAPGSNVSPADGDQDVEIIDVEKFLSPKKKPLSNTSCSPPASAWPKTSAGKRQVDGIGKSIANYPKKLRTSFKTLFDEIDDDLEDEEIPIKVKREMVKESAPGNSFLKGQNEMDLISVQLDAILKKCAQSLQETSDHTIQMTNIFGSLEYCHLGTALEKAAQQVSYLRDQVDLSHSRHAKLGKCLKNYSQQVSDCKKNISVLNLVRARLEAFGLKESPEEVSRLQGQVVKLDTIHSQLECSEERCAQLKASLEKSEQILSIEDDQVKRLLLQNRRSTQEGSQVQQNSLVAKFQSSLKEFDQLEGSIKKSAKNVRDLINEVGHLTKILAQVVDDVEQANSDFKVSSASTKVLYSKLEEKA